MAHIFNPKNRHRLDSPERRRALPPEETLRKLGLKIGDTIADIGCGIGYFTVPAAEIVGENGRVIGIDIAQEMLRETGKRAKKAGVENLDLRKTGGREITISKDEADFIFMSNVLHEFDDPGDVLEQCAAALKTGGRLVIIEWMKKETPGGPPMDHRLSRKQVTGLLETREFSVRETGAITEHMNFFVAEVTE